MEKEIKKYQAILDKNIPIACDNGMREILLAKSQSEEYVEIYREWVNNATIQLVENITLSPSDRDRLLEQACCCKIICKIKSEKLLTCPKDTSVYLQNGMGYVCLRVKW